MDLKQAMIELLLQQLPPLLRRPGLNLYGYYDHIGLYQGKAPVGHINLYTATLTLQIDLRPTIRLEYGDPTLLRQLADYCNASVPAVRP